MRGVWVKVTGGSRKLWRGMVTIPHQWRIDDRGEKRYSKGKEAASLTGECG
jgi:hypothetical protein